MGRSPLSMAICLNLVAICEIAALATGAHSLVQIPLAWAMFVLASGLTGQRLPWPLEKQTTHDDA